MSKNYIVLNLFTLVMTLTRSFVVAILTHHLVEKLLKLNNYRIFFQGMIYMYRGGWFSCLRRETNLFRASAQWFYTGSIPSQGKIMNVPVIYHEANMVLWALFTNVYRIIIMHEP